MGAMKRHTDISSSPATHVADPSSEHFADEPWGIEQENNDPVWDLLAQASTREPGEFFARDVVRATREMEDTSTFGGLGQRVVSFFTPRSMALAAAACVAAMAAYQMWPSSTPTSSTGDAALVAAPPAQETSLALSEIVIEESLAAAAEDPSLFTQEEVVAMIGF